MVGVAEQNDQPVLPPAGLQPEQIDRIQKELLNLCNAVIQPIYHPLTTTYEVQGKLILMLWVPGGELRPYKTRTRLGDPATTDGKKYRVPSPRKVQFWLRWFINHL